jgi:hypothetical protein
VPVSWVDGLGEHLFVLGNLSTHNLLGVRSPLPHLAHLAPRAAKLTQQLPCPCESC